MTIWLVRHAHAGDRGTWRGADDDRPLSVQGCRQADAVADHLADAPVAAVLSSPSMRCRETVAPLAAAAGLQIEVADELAEGADGARALARVLDAAGRDGDVVACSHGDVIPAVLRLLTAAGVRVDVPPVVEKGSILRLEVHDGDVVAGAYLGVPVVEPG